MKSGTGFVGNLRSSVGVYALIMIGRSAAWAIAINSVRQMGVTTNSAPALMAASHVLASRTVPTPIVARPSSFSRKPSWDGGDRVGRGHRDPNRQHAAGDEPLR